MKEDADKPITGTEASNAYCVVFGELRKGSAAQDASRKLAEAVDSARLTGKPATVTVKLTITPTGDSGAIALKDSITVKLPEPEKSSSLFFAVSGQILSRRDPRQQEMNLKAVTGGKKEPVAGPNSAIRAAAAVS